MNILLLLEHVSKISPSTPIHEIVNEIPFFKQKKNIWLHLSVTQDMYILNNIGQIKMVPGWQINNALILFYSACPKGKKPYIYIGLKHRVKLMDAKLSPKTLILLAKDAKDGSLELHLVNKCHCHKLRWVFGGFGFCLLFSYNLYGS